MTFIAYQFKFNPITSAKLKDHIYKMENESFLVCDSIFFQ